MARIAGTASRMSWWGDARENGVDLTYQFHGNPIDFYMRASR